VCYFHVPNHAAADLTLMVGRLSQRGVAGFPGPSVETATAGTKTQACTSVAGEDPGGDFERQYSVQTAHRLIVGHTFSRLKPPSSYRK